MSDSEDEFLAYAVQWSFDHSNKSEDFDHREQQSDEDSSARDNKTIIDSISWESQKSQAKEFQGELQDIEAIQKIQEGQEFRDDDIGSFLIMDILPVGEISEFCDTLFRAVRLLAENELDIEKFNIEMDSVAKIVKNSAKEIKTIRKSSDELLEKYQLVRFSYETIEALLKEDSIQIRGDLEAAERDKKLMEEIVNELQQRAHKISSEVSEAENMAGRVKTNAIVDPIISGVIGAGLGIFTGGLSGAIIGAFSGLSVVRKSVEGAGQVANAKQIKENLEQDLRKIKLKSREKNEELELKSAEVLGHLEIRDQHESQWINYQEELEQENILKWQIVAADLAIKLIDRKYSKVLAILECIQADLELKRPDLFRRSVHSNLKLLHMEVRNFVDILLGENSQNVFKEFYDLLLDNCHNDLKAIQFESDEDTSLSEFH